MRQCHIKQYLYKLWINLSDQNRNLIFGHKQKSKKRYEGLVHVLVMGKAVFVFIGKGYLYERKPNLYWNVSRGAKAMTKGQGKGAVASTASVKLRPEYGSHNLI